MFEDILYDVSEGVARTTPTRPDKLNALRIKTFEELAAGLRLADEDETVGVVVVAGAARVLRRRRRRDGPDDADERAGRSLPLLRADDGRLDLAVALSKPVVCAVQGACVGGGAEFTTFADLVIADETAYFLFNGTAIGGCSWWGRRSCSRSTSACAKPRRSCICRAASRPRRPAGHRARTRVVPAGELEEATDELCQASSTCRGGDPVHEGSVALWRARARFDERLRRDECVGARKGDLHAAFDAFREGRPMSWRALRPGLVAEAKS